MIVTCLTQSANHAKLNIYFMTELKIKKTNTTPLETVEQQAFVMYLDILERHGKIRKFSAIGHNTYTKSFSQLAKNKREGVRAGVLDLFIVLKQGQIWIEMKRKQGGTISPEQQEFADEINASGGKAFFAYGFEEAKAILNQFLCQ